MDSLSSVLMGQVHMADYVGAENTAQELLELHKKSGDLYRVPLIKYYQAMGQFYQGYLDQAGENLAEGLHLAQEQQQKSYQALCMASLGYYNLTLGLV